MNPDKSGPRSETIALVALGIVFLVLAILPRLLPEIELSRRVVLWAFVTHQVLMASVAAAAIWMMTGKRRSVALALLCLIILVWGPNFAGAIEYSLTGKNTNVLAVADWAGVTPLLNTMYAFLSDALGYSITISPTR